MKQLVAASVTMVAVVAGLVLAVSLASPAQEDGGTDEATTTTTTTTVVEDDGGAPDDGAETVPFGGRFSFRFGGEIPAELEEQLSCLADQGIEVPEAGAGGFDFDLTDEELAALEEALESCGIDFFGGGAPFGFGGFEGEIPFPDILPDFGAHSFGFGFGDEARDDLATCLTELGSFESVDEVRQKLDECLPERPTVEDFEGDLDELRGWFESQDFGGLFGFGPGSGSGAPFDFDFDFDFELDEPAPDGAAF